MIVIGLTGGIASGKSYVAGLLAERGALVLDADREAHAVLDETDVRSLLVERWGDQVVDESGGVRRSEVARRVFGSNPDAPQERRFLEGVVHPRVRERLELAMRAASDRGATAVVLDVPLLIEAGWADRCDAILFVDTPDEVRRARAGQRGWSADELARREAAQTPLSEKLRRADAVIPGDHADGAAAAVAEFWGRVVTP